MSRQEKKVNLAVFRRRYAAMRTVKARGATLDACAGSPGTRASTPSRRSTPKGSRPTAGAAAHPAGHARPPPC